ncbi:uncharacterized protein LOC127528739, partial [Erpetoichthys calabaricus]|uniref:uncharacterized protein LOC127528739 n=1 Tax=Erpetoichthys calabaricus TaxID=27687 RepID=UPI002234C615
RNGYERFHGGQGYGSRNEDGERALDCAEAHDLAVANTFFKKKLTHLVTYSSGGRETQIDYLLTRRQHLKLVTDVKVIPSTNICPQHRLLVMDLKLDLGQWRQVRTTNEEKIKWWRMAEGRRDLTEALKSINFNNDSNQLIETRWNKIADQIREAATNVLGKTKPGKCFIEKQTWWWNTEVQSAVKEKKSALKKWRQSREDEDYQRYKSLKAKKAVTVAKTAHYDQLYHDLDEPGGANKIYRLASSRHCSTKDIGQVKHIKDVNQKHRPRLWPSPADYDC